jgi:predicted RNA-binding Zn-ribbon protein involved in translation (DUF1610 family)
MEYAEMELRCSGCSHVERCGPSQMLARLQAAGALRRTREPEPELVRQLFQATASRFACQACGHQGLACREADADEWDDWRAVRPCQACGQPIAPERLEVFPQTKLCSACQKKEEVGGLTEVDYCPRCGDAMKIRLDSRGASRYVMSCPSCGART